MTNNIANNASGEATKEKGLSPAMIGTVTLAFHFSVLAFTLLDGVEQFLLPLGAWAVWLFIAVAGTTELPTGRLFFTWLIGRVNGDDRSKILSLQLSGFLVLVVADAIALLATAFVPDEYRQIYIVQPALGFTTAGFALFNLWMNREVLTERAERPTRIITVIALFVSVLLVLPYDGFMIWVGADGLVLLKPLFKVIPEIWVRGATSLAYDVLSAYAASFLRAGVTRSSLKDRHARACADFRKGAFLILGFFFVFPLLGQWIATGGGVLPGFIHTHPQIPRLQVLLIGQLIIAPGISSTSAFQGVLLYGPVGHRLIAWIKNMWHYIRRMFNVGQREAAARGHERLLVQLEAQIDAKLEEGFAALVAMEAELEQREKRVEQREAQGEADLEALVAAEAEVKQIQAGLLTEATRLKEREAEMEARLSAALEVLQPKTEQEGGNQQQ